MARILFIFDRVAHYHRDLFKALERDLDARGIELHLLSGYASGQGVGRVGVREQVVKRESKYVFREFNVGSYVCRIQLGVTAKIREIDPDVVVNMCHVGNVTHWKIAALKRRLGFILVAWQCGFEYHPGPLKNFLLRRFIPLYDYHLAYHSNARDYALHHGARAEQVAVMHNTINEEKIVLLPKDQARAAILAKHPQIGDRKIVLFVGAVLAEKRIEALLQALDIMGRDDVVLVLVGDGEHMSTIRRLSAARHDVVLTGAIIDGVGPYFDAADLYVLPGTGGLGLNEAMAHGLPIVSSYADGSADDLVIDGENGFRLPHNTPHEIAQKIEIILDDPELALRMGERSRALITGRFAFRGFVDRIVSELARLAESRAVGGCRAARMP